MNAIHGIIRAAGQELVGHDWDNGPQAWDCVRTENEEWLCLSNPEHTVDIVAALNAKPMQFAYQDATARIVSDPGNAEFWRRLAGSLRKASGMI